MSTLLVCLPAGEIDAQAEFDAVWWETDAHEGQLRRTRLALLPAAAEVLLLVPAPQLSWHRVALPAVALARTPAARLRALLAGLLEERLLDDPDELHLALAPGAQGGQETWVAACRRAPLLAMLQALDAAQRPVARIVPEFAPALPAAPDEAGAEQLWLIDLDGHPCWVASGPRGVLRLPLMPSSGEAQATDPAGLDWLGADTHTPAQAEPALAALAEHALGRAVPLQSAAQRWQQAAQNGWNLAQGDLARHGGRHLWRRWQRGLQDLWQAPRWRPARWALGLLLLSQLAGLNAWAWRERQQVQQLRQALTDTLTGTFPAVRTVIDAPLQMQRELAALRRAAGTLAPTDLEAQLGALASATPGQTPTRLDYASGVLRAHGLTLGASPQQALQAQGWDTRQEGPALVLQARGTRP